MKTYYLAGAMSKPSYEVKGLDPKSCTDLKCDDVNKCSCVKRGEDSNETIKCNSDCMCYKRHLQTGEKTCQNS